MRKTEPKKLKKSLGLFGLTIYGIGTIIGSGIYSVIAPATASAGAGIWLSFIFAAIAASFSAFSYAELASAFPSAGAEHSFLSRAFPKLPVAAFLVGLFIAIHGSATLAAVAMTFGQYARQYVEVDIKILAAVLLIAATLVNFGGLKKASWINVTFTCIQLSGLVVIAFAGFTSPTFSTNISHSLSETLNLSGVFAATSILFFIYTGYEHMASLSEETKNPERTIWKAFILSLVTSTVIYLAIIFSLLALLSPSDLAKSLSPLAEAGNLRSPILGTMISVAALLATANAVLSGSLSVSRLIFGMSRVGDLPVILSKTNAKSGSPRIAALAVLIGACIFLLLGELKFAASLSSLGALIVFSVINLAVIVLRFTKPNLKRPFRIPVSIARIPLAPALGILISLALAFQYDLKVYITFFLGSILGFAAYIFSKKNTKRRTIKIED